MSALELNDTLLSQRWPSQSAAESWLRRKGTSAKKLGCLLAMAEDKGVCLVRENGSVKPQTGVVDKEARKAATKRDLDLKVATGNLRADEADKRLAAQEAADAAGDAEDARPAIQETLVDWDTALPEDEGLISRDASGRPSTTTSKEAFIRFPTMGSRSGLRSWAAYQAIQMRTIIDVVSVDGKLIERFNGRGAAKRPVETAKPTGDRKTRVGSGNGAVATVQRLMVADQTLSVDAVTKILQEKGIVGTNASTIAMSRQMTLQVFACIAKKGEALPLNGKMTSTGVIRQLVVNDPTISVDAISAELERVGVKGTSPSTIVATRAATLSVLKLIDA